MALHRHRPHTARGTRWRNRRTRRGDAASFLIALLGLWAYFAVGRWLLRRLQARWPQADPVQVIWTAGGAGPKGLACEVDSCRGVVWRVNESDAVVRVEVNPPDAHAPRIATRMGPES